MDFWERIDSLIAYKNISRKELAAQAGFSYSSFTNGRRRASIPAADVALRIARTLGVTVEFLFDEENHPAPQDKDAVELIRDFTALSVRDRKLLLNLARIMAES